MSLPHTDSAESICTDLTCASEDFQKLYDDTTLPTDVLCDDALHLIIRHSTKLRATERRYRLDDLLSAMLEHAPHPLGRRYVAVCLHVAHQKGEDGLFNAAKGWLDYLLLPMLAMSKAIRSESDTSESSSLDTMSGSRADQRILSLRDKVALREQYYCAVTHAFDTFRVKTLCRLGRSEELPGRGPQSYMQVAYILPFKLIDFEDKTTDASWFWVLLQSWTQIDFKMLIGSMINSPTNAIYMTLVEQRGFRNFEFYFDKEVYPDICNKYQVHVLQEYLCLSNGSRQVDVVFPAQEESSVEPPNLDYLKVHAAFAKVLNLSGVLEYMEGIEMDAEEEGILHLDGKTDIGSYIQYKLAFINNQM